MNRQDREPGPGPGQRQGPVRNSSGAGLVYKYSTLLSVVADPRGDARQHPRTGILAKQLQVDYLLAVPSVLQSTEYVAAETKIPARGGVARTRQPMKECTAMRLRRCDTDNLIMDSMKRKEDAGLEWLSESIGLFGTSGHEPQVLDIST